MVFAHQTAVAGGVEAAVFSEVHVVDVAVDRLFVTAGPAGSADRGPRCAEEGVGDGGGQHLVAADRARLIEH
jgi:hypothetical protein